MKITPQHSRAARGLLDWTQRDLADAAGVGLSTVRDFETLNSTRQPSPDKLTAIRRALEKAGVELLDATSGGIGVRLKKRQRR